MTFKKYSLVKYFIIPPMAYCFYWSVWFKIGVLKTPFINLFDVTDINWIGFLVLFVFELAVVWREHQGRTTLAKELSVKSDNPFNNPAPSPRTSDSSGMRSFMHDRFRSWDNRFERSLDHIGQSTLPIRIVLKLKRFFYVCCLILYVAMALMSFSDPLFLVLFMFTAYAFLENLLWARHHQWAKRQRHDERNQ